MFDFRELLTTAIEALTRNKTRTALAALGIVIGIGAVIGLMSLGQSSQQAVENQIQSLGSNLLTISPGAQTASGGVRQAFGTSTTLTKEDADAITASTGSIPQISLVSPELSSRSQVTANRTNTNTQVIGVTDIYSTVHALAMSSGEFISLADNQNNNRVAVIGPQVASDLFGDASTGVGDTIRINRVAFRVIGITAAKGGTGFQNQDDRIYVPLSVAQKQLFGRNYLSSIAVQLKDKSNMTSVANEVGYILLDRHKITDSTSADFTIISQEDTIAAMSKVTGTMTGLLSGIAAISLLVGGIGIMNIMLVTVIERTREIGLRKALGARRSTIITQFLTESIFLTFGGGVIGIILGFGISYVTSKFLSLPVALSWSAVVLAVGVSAGIGILFGWYPARKAAGLLPIEALRYE
jgi:putative ABC transport system permease protein